MQDIGSGDAGQTRPWQETHADVLAKIQQELNYAFMEGENYETLEAVAPERRRAYALVPVGEAIAALRAAAAELKAAAPTRSSTASGAG